MGRWKVVRILIVFATNICLFEVAVCGEKQSATALSSEMPQNPLYNCTFHPSEIREMYEGNTVSVYLNCSRSPVHVFEGVLVKAVPSDPAIARIVGSGEFVYRFDQTALPDENSFVVEGLFLGRTFVNVYFNPDNGSAAVISPNLTKSDAVFSPNAVESSKNLSNRESVGLNRSTAAEESTQYRVTVMRMERAIDRIFIGLVAVLVICGGIGIGCKVDLAVVKEVLTKPIAPVIGFCCQYIIMPLTAFGLVRLFGLSGGQALGLFTTGCAPGGGSSNMYSYLLGGDVSLSVTLTLISIIASLFMIPLWLFTLGRLVIENDAYVRVPFENIVISLASLVIPVAIGILIQKKWTRGAKFIIRCLRPLYIIFILCMFTVGVYSNLYIFRLITPTLMIAGCLLPYTGFLLSGLCAFILRQPLPRVVTIAIETGIQNTGLPIILLKFSLPQPDADLSVVSPVVVAMFMPLPLWIAVAIVEIRKRCCRREGSKATSGVAATDTVDTNLDDVASEKLMPSNNNSVDGGASAVKKELNHKEIERNDLTVVTHDTQKSS